MSQPRVPEWRIRFIGDNTIYGNTCTNGIAGVYLEAGLPANTTNALVFQNNIVWANEDDGGDSGTPANEVSTALHNKIVYSAIQHTVNPNSSGNNIGPFSSPTVTSLGFVSETLSQTYNHDGDSGTPNIYNYHEYLHISNTSKCIDAGQPDVIVNGNYTYAEAESIPIQPTEVPPVAQFIRSRDFDDQLAFVDQQGTGNEHVLPSSVLDKEIARDTGADEYPSNESDFEFWWKEIGMLEN